ncbi:MAG: recombinase RecT, partial [Prevotellaceae bacterium]|nr:recombinase RecT [Prevotellaceae bacterium]
MSAMQLANDLSTMDAAKVIRDERVKEQFIYVYNSIWNEGGEAAYERESIYFNRQLRDNENLRKCTGLSIFYAFIDLAVKGLTLQPGAQAQCYLIPRNVKAGISGGRDVWEKNCNLTISGYGELYLRARAGQILHADNPVIVYDGDQFTFGEKDGHKFVNFASNLPHGNKKIIACFIKITRSDGTVDYSVMTEGDWKRLADYSAKNNVVFNQETNQRENRANTLYTSNGGQIDTGFLVAKCVKHAFKTYPKLQIGKGSIMQSDQEEQQPAFDPYTMGAQEPLPKQPNPDDRPMYH